MPLASSGSFFSSPSGSACSRGCRSMPGSIVVTARSASGPWQSSMKRTERPVSSASGLTSSAVDMSGRFCPLGRPKCDSSSTIAPLVAQFGDRRHRGAQPRVVADRAVLHRHVEIDAHQHALAGQVGGQVVEGLEPGHAQPSLAIAAGGVDHAVREAPFIVVPADHADQLALEHRGFEAVDGRACRIVVEVDRDQRLVGVVEDALQRPAFARRLEQRVDLFDAGVAARA